MESVKITATTETGKEALQEMKKQCSTYAAKFAFRRLKTTVEFTDDSVTISNPAMIYCETLDHVKSDQGIKQIIDSFSELGADQDRDYKIEMI